MRAWDLPTSITLGDKEYKIRTDYRAILDILTYFSDPEYKEEAWEICIRILYEDWETIPPEYLEEACIKASEFIDAGIESNGHSPKVMDWEQDAGLIIPAVNRVVGYEVRSVDYMHWWTFVGAYMEIGESLFSTVVSIRSKVAKGKKLEKEEREFMRSNSKIVKLQSKLTEEEKAEQDAEEKAIMELIGGR